MRASSIKQILLIFLLIIFMAGFVGFSRASSTNFSYIDNKIYLKSRQFIPNKGLDISRTDKNHFLIQLEHFPTKEEREMFERKGVKFLAYIPNNAWFVSFSGISPQKVINLPNVRWVGDITPEDKITPKIRERGFRQHSFNEDGSVKITVLFFGDISLTEAAQIVYKHGGKVDSIVNPLNALIVSISKETIIPLANEDSVQWLNELILPEIANDGSREAIGVNVVQSTLYNLNGTGVKIGEWDSGHVDSAHDDLSGRIEYGDTASVTNHSTHVASTIIGDGTRSVTEGGSSLQWRGIATKAKIVSYQWWNNTNELFADYYSAINTYKINLSSNSWGDMCDNGTYDENSAAIDSIIRGNYTSRAIPITFAAGNEADNYGWTSIRTPGIAKNVITVGAINSNDNSIWYQSSLGPTADGRIKPDVMAAGCQQGGDNGITSTITNNKYIAYCGTSQATPAVSGVIALMIQQYHITFDDNVDSLYPSTIKAILIHTATDINNTGPDYYSGWGIVNATNAVEYIINQRFIERTINNLNEVKGYNIFVPETAATLKVTLVWDDKPATPNAGGSTIQNNLQLRLKSPNSTYYYPWKLDKDNPQNPATTGVQNIDNVEQVFISNISNASAGIWVIEINASSPFIDAQNYSLVSSVGFGNGPSTPTSIFCDGNPCKNNGTFYGDIEINCSGSVDNESDQITYLIDAYFANSTNFSLNHFNNSLTFEDIVFNLTRNITRYLNIPKDANVTYASISLTGYEDFLSEKAVTIENASICSGTFNTSYPCSNALDTSVQTYALDLANDGNSAIIYENFTKTSGYNEGEFHFKSSPGACSNAYKIYYLNYSSDSWQLLMDRSGACVSQWKNPMVPLDGLTGSDLQIKTVLKVDEPCSWSGDCDNPLEARYYDGEVVWYNITYPTSPYLEVGITDGIHEWNYSGKFIVGSSANNFSSAINAYLDGCTEVSNNCTVPFLFHSDSAGRLGYGSINITYEKEYNWQNIENHTESALLTWQFGAQSIKDQPEIDLRCRAVDLNGSKAYSQYYNPLVNLSIVNQPLPVVSNLKVLYSNSTLRVFEFWVTNTGIAGNISWTFSTGDGTVVNIQNITLQINEAIPIIIEYNYSKSGQFTVTATAISENVTNSSSMFVTVGNLIVTELNDLTPNNISQKIFEFKIKNNENTSISNVNWSFALGDSNIIYASNLLNLTSGEEAFVYVDYNYSSLANRIVNATAFSASNIYSKIKYLTYLNVSNLAVLNSSYTKIIFGFNIKNLYTSNMAAVYWNLTLGDGNIINSTQVIALIPNEEIFVLAEYNYPAGGSYVINATARNGTLIDSKNITVEVA